MKIRCSVCEAAEGTVLCCADEATLCQSCDEKVHAANRVASKHQRVPLSSSSLKMPKCDICQETRGFFFCLEDRALLCRKCDMAIHSANPLVSMHQRFLLTGVRVGLEVTEAPPQSSSSDNTEKTPTTETQALSKRDTPSISQYMNDLPIQASLDGDFTLPEPPFSGGPTAGTTSQWQLDEFIGLGDFIQDFVDNSSSKADSVKLGDSYSPNILRAELEGDDRMAQVPDAFWAVPQVLSPPAVSGIHWPKSHSNPFDSTAFVPEVSSSQLQDIHQYDTSHVASSKRRRHA